MPPDPDQAWKALALVNEWLRHAETKLGATLAVTGVTGGVLFNLVKDRSEVSSLFFLSSVICGFAAFTAGACAIAGLFPVLRVSKKSAEDAVNPLFFHDVARAYKNDHPTYGAIFHTLTTNKADLVRHIAQQLHANAGVVQRKYRWANWSLRALLVDVAALSVLAAVITLEL